MRLSAVGRPSWASRPWDWRPSPPPTPEEAAKILRQLTRESEEEYAIIYIEENFAAQLHEIDKFKDSPTPAIILIPGREGSIGLGRKALNAAVERAVGTNILGD